MEDQTIEIFGKRVKVVEEKEIHYGCKNCCFNGMFGKVAPGMCRITMNGNIAVKTSDGYKSYNKAG